VKRGLLVALGVGVLLGGCLAPFAGTMPDLASARVAPDFETYTIRRVGLLPFQGRDLDDARSRGLQRALLSEVQRSTPWEVVLLDASDLEMVELSEPHRQGWYRPRTVIQLSRRHSLDALLFGTVTDERFYPPQLLSLSADLVSAETGLVIWSSSVHLDASDRRVLAGLRTFYGAGDGAGIEDAETAWNVALVSPDRFARFAAYQVARLL
jgi:hypothetical protein